jgi:hypothetical protein
VMLPASAKSTLGAYKLLCPYRLVYNVVHKIWTNILFL